MKIYDYRDLVKEGNYMGFIFMDKDDLYSLRLGVFRYMKPYKPEHTKYKFGRKFITIKSRKFLRGESEESLDWFDFNDVNEDNKTITVAFIPDILMFMHEIERTKRHCYHNKDDKEYNLFLLLHALSKNTLHHEVKIYWAFKDDASYFYSDEDSEIKNSTKKLQGLEAHPRVGVFRRCVEARRESYRPYVFDKEKILGVEKSNSSRIEAMLNKFNKETRPLRKGELSFTSLYPNVLSDVEFLTKNYFITLDNLVTNESKLCLSVWSFIKTWFLDRYNEMVSDYEAKHDLFNAKLLNNYLRTIVELIKNTSVYCGTGDYDKITKYIDEVSSLIYYHQKELTTKENKILTTLIEEDLAQDKQLLGVK